MKPINKNFIVAIIILFVANFFLFWRFYLKGLLPFPGDLLVSYYFPWNSGGFAGFDSWTTRKGVVAMDVVRQMYPWKDFIIDQIKNGQWPLWNPHNFSGTPLLANMQSSIFFPGNFIFFLLPKIWAWVSMVIGLPLIFSFFCYLFLRSLKLSNTASIFGAIAMSNISYLTVWAEQLIVIQSVLFLPLILLLINLYSQTKKTFLFWLISPLLAFSIFGGHPQSVVYVYLITFFYLLFKKVSLVKIFFCFLLSLGLGSIQLLPSLELYSYSVRENVLRKQEMLMGALPWNYLALIFAPDFFGSPATFNFRGINYDNFQAYFGVTAFLLALFGIFKKESKFFLSLAIFGLLFALPPLAYIGVWLNIPILSSGFPSRIVFIFGFAMTILAAHGIDYITKNKSNKLRIPIAITTIIFTIMIISTFFLSKQNQLISLKNMVIPITAFLLSSLIVLKFKKLIPMIIIVGIFEYSYLFNKLQPFAPAKFVFPDHPVFSFLQSTGFDRYFGVDRAYIDNNFATYYRVYAPEGYDPLYIKNYGELLSYPKTPSSSDAFIENKNSEYRNKLFDILAIKYIIDKTDEPNKDFGPNEDRFPPSEYTFIKQVNKWKYYQRKTALPRVFLASNFEIGSLEKVYDPGVNLRETLILEKTPDLIPQEGSGSAQIISYEPNEVIITTTSEKPKLLFLSDNYYPGWKVFVDNKENKILKANYTFRAVTISAGNHEVVFKYEPLSFCAGLAISLLSFIILLWRFF